MPECPECGMKLKRVHRRAVDAIKSKFTPLKRYRCTKEGCAWEGNLPDLSRESPLRKWLKWALLLLGAILFGGLITRI